MHASATPAYSAAQGGHLDALTVLVEAKVMSRARQPLVPFTARQQHDGRSSQLEVAAPPYTYPSARLRNNIATAGTGPAFVAAVGGDAELLRLLIAAKADATSCSLAAD